MADYSRPDPNPIYATTTTADTNWASNIISSNSADLSNIQWNGPIDSQVGRITLRDLDLTAYTEDELRDFTKLLAAYIDLKYPPKPPKFNSVEEADAWMEKHYGS